MERTLTTALARYDGKAITLLGQIEAEFGNDPEYLAALIDLLPSDQPHLESGATWLIKDRLERGDKLSQTRADQLPPAPLRSPIGRPNSIWRKWRVACTPPRPRLAF